MTREDFERRVLHGLCCEWERFALELRASERKGMVQPLFAIRNLKGRWGTWSSERREICLSSDLVHNHPWDAVREVLLHEMAHQYAEEVLRGGGEPPHGESFRRACRLLRANSEASGRYATLDQKLADPDPQEENGIPGRVRKLMALAQSTNPFEAEAAMDKAYELIRKHQLDLIPSSTQKDFVSAFVGEPALRHFQEHYLLANLLQEFYFVFGVWVPTYVLGRGRMGTVLEVTGRIQNVKMARYVHGFVMHFIESRWKEYTRHRKLNRYRKTDFAAGILEGFRRRLEERARPREQEDAGLVPIEAEDGELTEQIAYRYPRLRQVRGRPLRRHEGVHRDGIDIGRNLVLHKAIETRGGPEDKKLLSLKAPCAG
jgi:hypothetical protein